eukprot:7457906-Lingulodinium_polyedra.AAC.1
MCDLLWSEPDGGLGGSAAPGAGLPGEFGIDDGAELIERARRLIGEQPHVGHWADAGEPACAHQDAVAVRRRPAAAQKQTQPGFHVPRLDEKLGKVVENLAAVACWGSIFTCFAGWVTHVKRAKLENEIRMRYAEFIDRETGGAGDAVCDDAA